MTYRKLRPEVKKTLEKIVYQLELVGKTLQLMEQRVMDSEDKLHEVMSFIRSTDLDYKPQLVNKVLSMNRYDEVTGQPLQTESPKKDFGVPLPGDPSLAYTIEKNKLADLYGRFTSSVQMLGEHPEAREIMQSRGLDQSSATGRFQPPGLDPLEQQRREMMSMSNTGLGPSGLPMQPGAIAASQATAGADQLTSQMANLGPTAPANVFATMKAANDGV